MRHLMTKRCAYIKIFLACLCASFSLISAESGSTLTSIENGESTKYTNGTLQNDVAPSESTGHARPTLIKSVVDKTTHNSKENLDDSDNLSDENDSTHHSSHHIHLVNWKWEEYGKILTIALVLMLAGIIKLGFHHTPVLPNYMPESCVIILIGIGLGAIIYSGKKFVDVNEEHDEHPFDIYPHYTNYFPRFTSELFFQVLLPPIILDSAYSMYDRQFLDNLGGVLLFALVGTLFNSFLIGYGLYVTHYLGFMGELPVKTIDFLKFASLIAATDPVAVLAIFQEIGVNISLYFTVFGESLLNDGISVVLYNSMVALGQIELDSPDGTVDKMNYLLAFFSFFTVVFGGLLIGICIGIVTTIIVRFTSQTQSIEPFIIIVMAYISYILSETLHWSGIISLIGCGLTQKRYAFLNISKSSLTTVKNSVKTIATFSDVIIFLFLGIVTISHDDLTWHWGFCLWALFWCQIVRFAGVFLLTAILNKRLLKKISRKEQFIIAYGGLRGAVGFSLAIILSQSEKGLTTQIFLTATLFIVYFTVFLQGGTIKFLVNKLNIDKEEEKVKMISDDVNEKTIDLVMSGVGAVVGKVTYSRVLEKFQAFDKKFIQRWLLKDDVNHKMTEKLNKISLNEHYARLYGPTILAHQRKVNYVLKSIIPDVNLISMSPSGTIRHENGNKKYSLQPKSSSTSTSNGNKDFMFTNVIMDKKILQRAFSGNAFEKTRNARLMSSAGISDGSDSVSDQFDDLLREKRQKTRVIWQSAFSQIVKSPAVRRRHRTSSSPENMYWIDQDDYLQNASNDQDLVIDGLSENKDDRTRIKNEYEKAKNEYKIKNGRSHNFGEFNSATRQDDINKNMQNRKEDTSNFENLNMSMKMDDEKTNSKSTTRL